MAKARFTASAEADLLDLWLYIAEDNPLAADNSVDSIYRSAQQLAEQPMMGRARPELAAGLRSFPTQTPYTGDAAQAAILGTACRGRNTELALRHFHLPHCYGDTRCI